MARASGRTNALGSARWFKDATEQDDDVTHGSEREVADPGLDRRWDVWMVLISSGELSNMQDDVRLELQRPKPNSCVSGVLAAQPLDWAAGEREEEERGRA
ncbi:hypothetical protein NPX13_g9549 [Xylaria arbuscula]|uniref:Uncharacterized protein n=1 Tax=Xylaria arbuscula TaxID=114810 RepID=A0A9W8N6I1_9PEZI|nr:hypothetical protein NPX13_g9549 [Xylaria arbuscula]